jgi:hypothetical protein
MYNTQAESRCEGCKSPDRMKLGCPFITCAVKASGLEFCWDCQKSGACEKWRKHRDTGKVADSFKCYQTLDHDIEFVTQYGVEAFLEQQKQREQTIKTMLNEFNNGRSKSYYCIAATVLSLDELGQALVDAKRASLGFGKKKRR